MNSFKGRHFPKDIILIAVRWYLAYSLSTRDIEELMLERGIKVNHGTINRWIIAYSSQPEANFRKKYKSPVGSSWRMDERYIKAKGKGCYLYRAADKAGKTIDFMLSGKRDKKAAKRFFNKATGTHGLPSKITIDKSGANKSALKSLNAVLTVLSLMPGFVYTIVIRDIKNIVKQDHRGIKKIVNPMMGFKAFHAGQATLAGIELHHRLKKSQHKDVVCMDVFEQFYALTA